MIPVTTAVIPLTSRDFASLAALATELAEHHDDKSRRVLLGCIHIEPFKKADADPFAPHLLPKRCVATTSPTVVSRGALSAGRRCRQHARSHPA
jgi:hypothetical protein